MLNTTLCAFVDSINVLRMLDSGDIYMASFPSISLTTGQWLAEYKAIALKCTLCDGKLTMFANVQITEVARIVQKFFKKCIICIYVSSPHCADFQWAVTELRVLFEAIQTVHLVCSDPPEGGHHFIDTEIVLPGDVGKSVGTKKKLYITKRFDFCRFCEIEGCVDFIIYNFDTRDSMLARRWNIGKYTRRRKREVYSISRAK